MLDENNQSFNNNSSRLLLDGGDLSFKEDDLIEAIHDVFGDEE